LSKRYSQGKEKQPPTLAEVSTPLARIDSPGQESARHLRRRILRHLSEFSTAKFATAPLNAGEEVRILEKRVFLCPPFCPGGVIKYVVMAQNWRAPKASA
jgi:hypothetical protein